MPFLNLLFLPYWERRFITQEFIFFWVVSEGSIYGIKEARQPSRNQNSVRDLPQVTVGNALMEKAKNLKRENGGN